MKDAVIIDQEVNNRSRWIRVFVPESGKDNCLATIQDKHGAVLKRLSLAPGQNAIDISSVSESVISIKIETPFETILKEIKSTA